MAGAKDKPTAGSGSRTGKDARSGPSLPEDQRTDRLLSLRLSPELRARLDAAAERHGSRPRALAAALDALEREEARTRA